MTLSDCAVCDEAIVVSIAGDDSVHRRLADMGLLGARVKVLARRGRSILVEFDDFSAVLGLATASQIEVDCFEACPVRKPQRRQNDAL